MASPEPGFVVQVEQAERTITAASAELGRETLAARLAPLACAGLELVVTDDERAVLWEKAARLAVLAAATVASGQTDRRASGRPRLAAEARGRARRGVRRRGR